MTDPSRANQSSETPIAALLRRINQAWLEGRPRDLAQLFHPEIVMVLPGFAGRVQGREQLVNGFVDFCQNAKVQAFEEAERQIDVVGNTAVASVAFTMVYERAGQRFRSTGRDVWVFAREGAAWLATWRTMLDVAEEPAEPS